MKYLLLLAGLLTACSPRQTPPSVGIEVLEVRVELPRLDTDEYLESPALGVRLKMTNLTDGPLVFDASTRCAARPSTLVLEHPNGRLRLHATLRGCGPDQLTLAPHTSLYPIVLANRREFAEAYDFTEASYATLMAFKQAFHLVYVQPDGEAIGKVGSFTLNYRRHP
ncbi:hypothetical protein Q5H92_10600 [Hymenobacter sp. M29]|uniref:Lipoprotein n=1 Tax=Hymenobacter mellowenesis TaxID=3063995 RepID=A0ABT9AAE3_9BACT|nr:hypothetical protein [Hymenobacter sp. M29]MDO7846807.1 hypothetical protein [Hymenobacter sp. M29]